MKAKILIDDSFNFNNGYVAIIKVFEVKNDDKFPEGIKAKFILINKNSEEPELLIDNHEPFSWHIHNDLPHNHEKRETLKDIKNYNDALALFWREVEKVVNNE
jgi:hypothetical protein